MELLLRLESVVEGVLVTGTAHATVKGECVRCLERIEQGLDADFQELYHYPDVDDRFRAVLDGVADGSSTEGEETIRLEGDLFDLQPVLRDAVVLALPLQPVCRENCPGLCTECGVRLADDPDHHHDTTDSRWAALQGLDLGLDEAEEGNENGGTDGAGGNQEN